MAAFIIVLRRSSAHAGSSAEAGAVVLPTEANSLSQRRAGAPAEGVDARSIEQLAWRAVRLARVEADLPGEADHLHDDFGQLADADVGATADVDQRGRGVLVLHDEHTGVGQIIDEQELAQGIAR